MPYVERYLREGRQPVGAIEQDPGPIKTRGFLVSPIGGQAATDNWCMRRALCCCLYRDFRPAWRV